MWTFALTLRLQYTHPSHAKLWQKGVATQHERDDAESEESDGRHEEQDTPKIIMAVRKWNGKVKKIDVSKAKTIQDFDKTIDSPNSAVTNHMDAEWKGICIIDKDQQGW